MRMKVHTLLPAPEMQKKVDLLVWGQYCLQKDFRTAKATQKNSVFKQTNK